MERTFYQNIHSFFFFFFLGKKKINIDQIFIKFCIKRKVVLLSEMSTKYAFHNNTESSAMTDSDL